MSRKEIVTYSRPMSLPLSPRLGHTLAHAHTIHMSTLAEDEVAKKMMS